MSGEIAHTSDGTPYERLRNPLGADIALPLPSDVAQLGRLSVRDDDHAIIALTNGWAPAALQHVLAAQREQAPTQRLRNEIGRLINELEAHRR